MKQNLFIFILLSCLFSQIYAQSTLDKAHKSLSEKYDFVSCFDEEGLALIGKKAKFGYLDKNGKIVVPFIYDSGEEFRDGKAAVTRNGKWGFVDSTSKEIIPCEYDNLGWFVNGIVVLTKKTFVYWINEKGEILDSMIKKGLTDNSLRTNCYVFYRDTTKKTAYHYIESQKRLRGVRELGTGKMIIDTAYSWITQDESVPTFLWGRDKNSSYAWNLALGKNIDIEGAYGSMIGRYFLLGSKKNTQIFDTNLTQILSLDSTLSVTNILQDSLMLVTQIDSSKIDTFENIYYNANIKASVYQTMTNPIFDADGDGSSTSINSTSCNAKPINKTQTNTYSASPSDSIYIGVSKKIGLMNMRGKWIIAPTYQSIGQKNEHYLLMHSPGQWHIIEIASGKETAHFPYYYFPRTATYSETYLTQNGSVVTQNKARKSGMYAANGKILIPFEYDLILPLYPNKDAQETRFFRTFKGKLKGLIDENGNELLPCTYIALNVAGNDMVSIVNEAHLLGFLNLKTQQFISPKYYTNSSTYNDYTPSFSEGLVFVLQNREYGGYIDSTGKEITRFVYTGGIPFKNGIALAETANESYIINKKGKRIHHNADFEVNIDALDEGGFAHNISIKQRHLLKDNHKYGLIDDEGKIIISPIYTFPSHVSNNELIGTYTAPEMKFGLADTTARIIMPVNYTYIEHENNPISYSNEGHNAIAEYRNRTTFMEKYRIFEDESGKGILDRKGNILHNTDYQYITKRSEHEWWCVKNNKVGIINDKYETLLPFEYDYVQAFYDEEKITADEWGYQSKYPAPSAYAVQKGKKWGVISPDYKNFIIPLKMDSILSPPLGYISFYLNRYYFVKEKGKYGIFDSLGKRVFPSIIENIPAANVVQIKDKYQFLTSKGNLLPEKYDSLHSQYWGNIYVAFKENQKKYLNNDGKEVLSPDYQKIIPCLNKKFIVKKQNKYGIVEEDNRVVTPCRYDSIASIQHHFFVVYENRKIGVLDSFFQLKIPPKYDKIEIPNYNNLYFKTQLDNKYGVISNKGKEILPPIYENVYLINTQSQIKIELNGKKGLANKEGKIILEPDYQQVANYKREMAVVQKDNKCGAIDSVGRFIVPLKFEGMSIENQYIITKTDCKYGLWNSTGKELLTPEYDIIRATNYFSYAFEVVKEDKTQIYFTDNQQFINANYANISSCSGSPFFQVSDTISSLKYGLIDRYGKEILPMKYTIFWANPTDKEIHAKGREGEESVLINFKGEKISPKVQSLHSCK